MTFANDAQMSAARQALETLLPRSERVGHGWCEASTAVIAFDMDRRADGTPLENPVGFAIPNGPTLLLWVWAGTDWLLTKQAFNVA